MGCRPGCPESVLSTQGREHSPTNTVSKTKPEQPKFTNQRQSRDSNINIIRQSKVRDPEEGTGTEITEGDAHRDPIGADKKGSLELGQDKNIQNISKLSLSRGQAQGVVKAGIRSGSRRAGEIRY